MAKILSQAGQSLADLYDVEGSIAGIDQLITSEVTLAHEMGATLFSERLNGSLLRGTTGAILQNATWDIVIEAPLVIYRVVGVFVMADNGTRTDNVQVSLRAVHSGREIPIFMWNVSDDGVKTIRIVDNDAAVANTNALMQTRPAQILPSFGVGTGQGQADWRVGDEIMFRGLTSGFGAGTVVITALIYVLSSQTGLISSVGLPVPSW